MPKEDIFHAIKAIVATQRDYGRRDDRKYSRLKYLVQEWGLPKFRSVVEQYYGKRMQAFRCARRAWLREGSTTWRCRLSHAKSRVPATLEPTMSLARQLLLQQAPSRCQVVLPMRYQDNKTACCLSGSLCGPWSPLVNLQDVLKPPLVTQLAALCGGCSSTETP